MIPKTARHLIAAGLAITVLLGACSDGDDPTSTPVDETADHGDDTGGGEPPASSDAVEPTEAAAQPLDTVAVKDSVLAILRGRADLTTFTAAAEALGTPGVFTQERGVTILAPDDDAFAQLAEEELEAILEDPVALAAMISDHLAVGISPLDTLVDREGFANASAETLTVEVDGETIIVGGATVVEGDLAAGNGVVHIIDRVALSVD